MGKSGIEMIYWYVIGSLRRDLLDESHGGDPLLPALGEFAQESVFFANAFASSGSSFLSAASMLTGLRPSRLGIRDCPIMVRGQGLRQAFALDSEFQTLSGRLAEQGYRTFSHPESLTPLPGDGLARGFTDPGALPESLEEGRGVFIWHHAKGSSLPFEPTGLALDALGLESGGAGGKRPEDQKNLYRAAAFDADRAFARAMGDLSGAGLWDRTLIVVTADHGLELYDHGGFGSPSGLYQENLAVPLFIKFPADHPLAAHHGRSVGVRVRLTDLAPSLALAAIGEEMPDTDGEDLLPLIGGQEQEERNLIAFQSALAEGAGEPVIHESLATIQGSFKAIGGFRAGEVRDGKGAIRPPGDEIRELYDLARDPAESLNLVEKNPDLFEEMMIAAAVPAVPPAESGPDRPSGAVEEEKEALVEKLRSLGYI